MPVDIQKIKLPMQVEFLLNRLHDNGFASYVVGGCVRDLALGIRPHDYDICTSAKPEQVAKLFDDCTVIDTGIKHGTVTVILREETDDRFKSVEITTFRIDGTYNDNRHPETVEYTDDLTQDLARRDFTINAMAYNYYDGFVDPFGGLKDLRNRLIHCVGRPEDRFNEDALRILRGLRFSFRYGFNITPMTFACMDSHKHLLKNISKERICDELTKILSNKMFLGTINDLEDSAFGLFIKLVNLLSPVPINLNLDEIFRNLFDSGENLVLRLALLFRNTNALDALKSLRFPNEISFAVSSTIFYGNKLLETIKDEEMFNDDLVHLARKLLSEIKNHDPNLICRYALILTDQHEIFKTQNLHMLKHQIKLCREKNDVYSLQYLAVNGNDLLAEGYEGKEIGDTLSRLLYLVMYDRIKNTKEDLLAAARKIQLE